MLREYLRLTRAHTTPLEAVPAFVGAYLGSGSITLGVIGWTVYGVLYHLAGYGMNSYTDWVGGYDKDDQNKQHHPLNTGEISQSAAKRTVVGLFILTGAVAVWLSAESTPALIVLASGVAAGLTYNLAGKEDIKKPLYISHAHATVFAVPYLAIGGSNPEVLVAGYLMVFFWVVFQIGISGEVKDLPAANQSDEKNILDEKLGCSFDDVTGLMGSNISKEAYEVSLLLRVLTVLVFVVGAYIFSDFIGFLVVVTVGVMTLKTTVSLMTAADSMYDRGECLSKMATIEIQSLVMFLFAFRAELEELAIVATLVSGVVVLSLNKYLWGTWLAPDV
jgi:hypothetical protein